MLAMSLADGSGFDDAVNCASWAGGSGSAMVHVAMLIMANTGSIDSLLSPDMSRSFVSIAAWFGSRITYAELEGLDHGFFGGDYWNYGNMTSANAGQYAKSVCTTLNFVNKTSQDI